MIRAALRDGKSAVKRLLKACGLGPPLRAIQRRTIHTFQQRRHQPRHQSSLEQQFDRTRVSVAVQADMTRAAIAHETDLIQAVLRMHTASLTAALAEQSEQTRALLFDTIHGYRPKTGIAERLTDCDTNLSAHDIDGFLDSVRHQLQGPLTGAEIIGACKVICTQLPPAETVQKLLEAHRRELFEKSAVLSKIVELIPEETDRLHGGLQCNTPNQFRVGPRENGAERLTA